MGNIEEETRYILKKYNISANKSLGQNFLIDDESVYSIVDIAEVCESDLVIEIGPGLGTLTARLLEKAKKVIAIELDKRMIEILNQRFSLYNNFELVNNDVLKVDLNKLIKENKKENEIKNVKIVANLPYYITTPIIMKLLEDNLDIESITVMVQKEVAKRLTAKTSEKLAGAITYSVDYYCDAQEKLSVPKECFIPSPEVDSSVIKLILRKEPKVKVKDKELFFKLIKASFMQRRKTFLNGVANSKLVSKDEIRNILNKLGFNENVRGEELTIEQFAEISDMIVKNIKQ